ncbi:serine hydrolase [Aeromicrobium sp. CF4.19]|uniref:serine hydrolase n=1 Tax=Aeromicrobium sp. CF4.19 TaxID=3373082 RepID=UPI003EE5D77E
MILRLGAVALLTSLAVAVATSEAKAPHSAPDGGTALPPEVSRTVELAAIVASPLGASTVPAPRPDAQDEALDRLARAVEAVGPDVSVAILDVGTGRQLDAGKATAFGASTMKIDILATLLSRQDGRLEGSQRALARSMITVSDNEATDVLLERAGGADAVNAFTTRAGLEKTTVGGDEWGRTRTSAADRLSMLRAVLGDDALIGARGERTMRSLMSRVAQDQRVGVPAAADDPDAAVLKAGYLQDESSRRWHVSSMGEVRVGGRDYLLAVISSDNRTLERGLQRIERTARLTVAEMADFVHRAPAA